MTVTPRRVHSRLHGRIAVLTIDNPPVNALASGVADEIEDAVVAAASDERVDAVILIGGGRTFVAGADIKIFLTLTSRQQSLDRSAGVHARWRRLEDVGKPTIAAIHGQAFGGGFELAMACHYRVAAPDAQVGQPEVMLGIIPGAGGSQRLPRLCGIAMALDMCTTGRPVSAVEAHDAGLVDVLATGDLLHDAIRFATEHAIPSGPRRSRDGTRHAIDIERGLAECDRTRAALEVAAHGREAPLAAVEAIRASLTNDFEEGSRRERELFADRVLSAECRGLIHLFFAERQAGKPSALSREIIPRDIRRAAVVGAGATGSRIVRCLANAGVPVLLQDVSKEAADEAIARLRDGYAAAVSQGEMRADQAQRALGLLRSTAGCDGFAEADIVVEATPEDLALKPPLFEALAAATSAECVLASATAVLAIDSLALACGRPSSVIGLHVFQPGARLLEIVRGAQTSAESLATALRLARRLGMQAVVVGDASRSVANRLLDAFVREATTLVEEGTAAVDIERALIDFGMHLGPFALRELNGLDAGAKHGERAPSPEDARVRRAADADEMVSRLVTMVANEGARVIDDGLVERASDIDVIFVNAFGFPRHRGGPLFHADTIGADVAIRQMRDHRRRSGEPWTPAPLLERFVAEGRGFYTP